MHGAVGKKGTQPSQPDQLGQPGDQQGDRCHSQVTLTSTFIYFEATLQYFE